MFERNVIGQLKLWKAKPDRKPLLMLGARQVGKTFVLKQFGREEFAQCAYFSLDEKNGVADIFRKTNNPKRIVEQLSYLCEVRIEPDGTLLVLDESHMYGIHFRRSSPKRTISSSISLCVLEQGHGSTRTHCCGCKMRD